MVGLKTDRLAVMKLKLQRDNAAGSWPTCSTHIGPLEREVLLPTDLIKKMLGKKSSWRAGAHINSSKVKERR